MRPGGINVAVPAAVRAMQARIDGRANGRAMKATPRFLDSSGNVMKRPAIQGFACLFDTAFEHEGRIVVFEMGAFIDTLHDCKPKALLFNHDSTRQVGSTSSGLEFANTIRGMAFRYPLAGEDGETIYRNVVDGERACLSVGIAIEDSKVKRIAGHDVEVISRARLDEISLVAEGAVPETFASIVDLDSEPDLWTAARSPSFTMSKASANASARARRVASHLKRLGQ
jgi:HK97 family phage prohead protease